MSKYTLEEQKANRKKWIAALRSGEYKQGQGQLETFNGSLCCLGVLSKIAGVERRELWYDAESDIYVDTPPVAGTWPARIEYGKYQETDLCPVEAMEWVGLNDSSGVFDNTDTGVAESDLASMNDNGTDFDRIADLIEAEPEGLFVWNSDV